MHDINQLIFLASMTVSYYISAVLYLDNLCGNSLKTFKNYSYS